MDSNIIASPILIEDSTDQSILLFLYLFEALILLGALSLNVLLLCVLKKYLGKSFLLVFEQYL